MLEMKLIVRGMVQGVGFRYFIVNSVEEMNLDISGYVRNLPDGSVEILAHGNIEDLKQLRKIASTGPERSSVRLVEEDELSPIYESQFSGFKIIV